MKNEVKLAPAVLHFLQRCIPTVPHLEALLLMSGTIGGEWTVAQLAARIYVEEGTAGLILHDLQRVGMVACDTAQPPRYKYEMSNTWVGTLPLVAQTYRSNLRQVTRYIHSQGPKTLRERSRALRFEQDP